MHALSGVLAALYQRQASADGCGQRVDTSMLAVTANLMERYVTLGTYLSTTLQPDGEVRVHLWPLDGGLTVPPQYLFGPLMVVLQFRLSTSLVP
jgi:crotonobetainyl-CoA:carnitine CoA-transferase CaiB-like acyl-CoA transferase